MEAKEILPANRKSKDLVGVAWDLLDSSVDATKALDLKGYKEDNRKDMKIVCALLNSTINSFKASQQLFRLSKLPFNVDRTAKMLKKRFKK